MLLNLKQSSDGYRYSIDAFLLANFCIAKPGAKILELGTGCGIISFILAKTYHDSQITGIEIQPELIRLARENLKILNYPNSLRFIHGDIRKILNFFSEEEFDIVITNPPYHKIGSGRINFDFGEASAKHEIFGELMDFIKAGERVLKNKGVFYLIFTANRIAELINRLIECRIEPKIIRNVHSRLDTEANLVLMKAVKNGKPGMKILPPLFIYKINGEYTNEAARIIKNTSF